MKFIRQVVHSISFSFSLSANDKPHLLPKRATIDSLQKNVSWSLEERDYEKISPNLKR